MWTELISRVGGFRRPRSAELDSGSKAADQQDTNTHTVITRDGQTEIQRQADKFVTDT